MKSSSVVLLVLLAACVPGLPGPGGGASSVAPEPGRLWDPERSRLPEVPQHTTALPTADQIARRGAVTLTDVVDLALQNNPTTRITWANARAAAARLGADRGGYLPTAQVDLRADRRQTAGTSGLGAVEQETYGPSATFTWLLFDFERGANVGAARNALLAADWTHNAAVQDVVLDAGKAYYTYAAARALLVAQRATKAAADTNLQAAEERRRVGVATIAEVLQARTAVAQAQLELHRTEGDVAATRGALAVATGFPATAEFDVDTISGSAPVGEIVDSIEALLATARAARPDLAAAAATYGEARANARSAFGRRLPSLIAQGNVGRTYLAGSSEPRESYSVGLGLSIPLFNGFTWEYDALAAREVARAQAARAEQLGQRAVLEVFTGYFALRTATQSVRTSDELYASASESAQAALGRYRAGVGSLLELLTAESALGDARAIRIQARLNWHIALLQLAHDVGVLDARGGHSLRVVPDPASPAPAQ
jgi:outer membrane protein